MVYDVVERREVTLHRSVNRRYTHGPVRVILQSDRVVTDPLGESIRRLAERSTVRQIDRDIRHLRGFSPWVK